MDERYSYWRVWVDGDSVRVARDDRQSPNPKGPQLQPQHLDYGENGYLVWKPHEQGGDIASVSMWDFTAWLNQGGT